MNEIDNSMSLMLHTRSNEVKMWGRQVHPDDRDPYGIIKIESRTDSIDIFMDLEQFEAFVSKHNIEVE